jgi:hypothetical protein
VGAMLTSRQLLQAWHVGFFPLPWLAEAAIRSRGGRFAVALLKHSGLGDDLAGAYADRLINDPGGLAGALRWYRAMPVDISIAGRAGAVTVPTTYVWSTDDAAIGRRAAQPTSRWATGPFDFTVLEGVFTRDPRTGAGQTGRVHPGTDRERVAGDPTGASPRSTSPVSARRSILHAIGRCPSTRWSVRGLTIEGP